MYRIPALLSSCAQAVAAEGRKRHRPAPLAMELLEPLEALTGLFVVKNTFIDMLSPRSPSLAAFYRKRVARSCPPKRIGCLPGCLQEVHDRNDQEELPSPCRILTPCSLQTPQAPALPQVPLLPQECSAAMVPQSLPSAPVVGFAHHEAVVGVAARTGLADRSGIAGEALPPPLLQCMATRPVYAFAAAAAAVAPPPPPPPTGPAPGSLELPSLGSLGHSVGDCRPCAFLHTKGCSSGPACKFCHLCGPGERKRRLREKREKMQQEKARRMAAKARAAEAKEALARERVVSL